MIEPAEIPEPPDANLPSGGPPQPRQMIDPDAALRLVLKSVTRYPPQRLPLQRDRWGHFA